MASLLVGPMLRYVSDRAATVWIESDAACEVEVLGRRARTFAIGGHHYALVTVDGLEPGQAVAYEVRLDGRRAWPTPGSRFPASTIRVPRPGEPGRIVFGSCRVTLPHEPPFSLPQSAHPQGHGYDALRAFALRASAEDPARLPHLLLFLGDQIYACEGAPETRAFIRSRRDVSGPPGTEPADFEEYAQLYRESWEEPAVRWLLSTVPSAMLACDHDVCEDWNTSAAWVREMRANGWWPERVTGALMAFWLYQHLGNLAPDELDADPLYRTVSTGYDGERALREFAERASREPDARRFSHVRDVGDARVVAIDTRTGRVLSGHRRLMVDDTSWEWIERQARSARGHLVLASALPFVMPEALHDLEGWSERVCAGAWGASAARLGERVRRRLSLEQWPAFQASFARVASLLEEIATRSGDREATTIVMVSGDLHHGYLAEVAPRSGAPAQRPVYQAVCSPFRNPLHTHERWIVRALHTALARALIRALARAAGLRPPTLRWRIVEGPVFDNQIGTLEMGDSGAWLTVEGVLPGDREPMLGVAFARRLAPAPVRPR